MVNHQSRTADRVTSLVIGISIIATLVMLFIDWRFSVITALVVWNQLIFKKGLRREGTGIQMWLSLGIILIAAWYLFFV